MDENKDYAKSIKTAKEIDAILWEGMVFKNSEDIDNYINSCMCELETNEFLYDENDFLCLENKSDLYLKYNLLDDEDRDSDEELYDIFDAYYDNVSELLDNYDIEAIFKKRTPTGPIYILRGTYKNLEEFYYKYRSSFDENGNFTDERAMTSMGDDDNPNVHLAIDVNSGEDKYLANYDLF